MRFHSCRTARLIVGSALLAAFCSADAYADIYTFWKTSTCPRLGAKQPIAQLPGLMQGLTSVYDVGGGPFCVATDSQHVVRHRHKDLDVASGNVIYNQQHSEPVDPQWTLSVTRPDGSVAQNYDVYQCVICQYENKIASISMPTLSNLGMLILVAGIATTWFWQRRKEAHAKAI